MKNLSVIAFLLAQSVVASLFTACKKDHPDSPQPPAGGPDTASYVVDGATITPRTVEGSYSNQSFGVITDDSIAQRSLIIGLVPITATGTFTNATITYTASDGGWSCSLGVVGSSRVQVTHFDTATRKASGTFTATLEAFPGTAASGLKTISSGTFTNVDF